MSLHQTIKTLLILLVFAFNSFYLKAEGTKQLMPNSTDRLWIELNDNDNGYFGNYGCPEQSRINIFMNKDEIMHFGFKLPDNHYLGYEAAIRFRIKDHNGNIVYGGANGITLPTQGNTGYIENFNEAVSGPNAIKINGTTVTGGYDALKLTANQTGNYYIEFQTYDNNGYNWVNYYNPIRYRCAFEFFDITVTDAAGNLMTNPGEPNVPAGRLWSKRWRFSNTSFTEYPCKAGFYVFTEDEFVNRVEFEVKPFGFGLSANSFGINNDANSNYVENAQSIEGDNGANLFTMSEYKIFFNDPDRIQWTNTKLPPPSLKVWFEDELILDYDYDRTPLYLDLSVDTVRLEKNDSSSNCTYSDITMFRVESNIDGFSSILLDLNNDGIYTPNGNDRALHVDIKKGLNYILWDCKDDSNKDVPDGSFSASATFLGRGPANFPLYDVETLSGVRSQSIRPFNKLDPTIYWDDRNITNWGDVGGAMVETQKHQLVINDDVPRMWTYDGNAGNRQNGNYSTLNTWYNAIDLGLSKINFTFTTSSTKCINGDAPYVGDVFINSAINTPHTYTATDFSDKFFDPNNYNLSNIRILSLPSNGTLTFNSAPVSINQPIAIGNIANLKYTPNTNYNGKDNFMWDAQNTSGLWTLNNDTIFMISNTPPTISDIPDQNICTSTDINNIPFTVNDIDPNTSPDDLIFTIFSHDLKVLKNNDITIGGSGTNRTLNISPNPNIWGYAIIYVMVDDGFNQVIEDFALTINPNMGFTGDTTVCTNDPVELTAVEYGATYNWSFNSNTVSSDRKLTIPSFDYSNSGIYTLTISKGGCTETREIDISASPIISFTGDTKVCTGEPISLSANETVANYSWKKSGTEVATSKVYGKTATLADNGTYNITVSKEGCTNTSNDFTISVIDPPTTALTLTGATVSKGWDATIVVSNATNGITYRAYINNVEVKSEVGTGTNLNITIPSAYLQIGTNQILVTAENANCELQLDNTTTVIVNNPGITITPTSGLVTDESGTTATFTAVLNAKPLTNVTISISSSNTAEGTVSPASIIFTPTNWNNAQTVTITGVNDDIDDGNIAYTIVTEAASSTDPNYSGMDVNDVTVTNNDDADTYGVTVSSITQNTREDGTQGTFTIVLNSKPTANVTIGLSSSNLNEGTISPTSIVFTPANWNSARTVTVTGVDDSYNDGNIAYNININNAVSTDANYTGLAITNVTLSNIDDDAPGIIISQATGLTTTETAGAGNTTTVKFSLSSKPYHDVTIGVTSGDPTEGSLSTNSIVLTNINWNTGVYLTITGINDNIDDGDITYSITTNAASSVDADYNNMLVADISVTNTDDDYAGFTINPTSGLITTEAGGTAQFTIRLNSQPTGNITIGFVSSNTNEGTVSPASFVFNQTNWNNAQTITITGVNDNIDDGNIGYTINTNVTANAATEYNSLNPADVTVTNNDDADAVGITVTPKTGLTTTEAGGTAQFTVRLNSQPTANVTITLTSSDISEGTVPSTPLTFNSTNWNSTQTVTITGVNDNIVDGNQPYTITVVTSSSGDANYNSNVANEIVNASNTDMGDVAGFVISTTSGLSTAENGTQASFNIHLSSEPLNPVTITLASTDISEGTVSPTSITFNSTDWNSNQTITITGVNDAEADGNQSYQITSTASSSDINYNGLTGTNVSVTNIDGDVAGINVSPISRNTNEDSRTATFTVVLTSQPTANVTIGLASSDITEGKISASSISFTNLNWNTPQTITVTGQDDNIDDGNVTYFINTALATSTDSKYNGIDANNVTIINEDNGDAAGITVTPTTRTTTEASGTSQFTIVLTSEPTANVIIGLTSSNISEGTINRSSLTFTPSNWSIAQTVTITGVNDFIDDGDIIYTIITNTPTTTDNKYSAINPDDVSVTNTDNDTYGITVTPTSGLTTTEAGGTANFSVVLTSMPTGTVTIPVSSSNTNEGTVSASSIVIAPANWNTPVNIIIAGINDNINDGNQPYIIDLGVATSTDTKYNGINPTNVTVTNTDNDNAGITVSKSSVTTTEASGIGHTATFEIVLTSEPIANVVIGLNSTNINEATVTSSITFTSSNWNIAQTITVTGIDDNIDDGDQNLTIQVLTPTTTDANYAAINPNDVTVKNIDNDNAAIKVTPTSGLVTNETGTTATFSVVLESEPTANIVINLSSTDVSEGKISTSQIIFNSTNWNIAQTITITGQNDNIDDGNVPYTIIVATPVTADGIYALINPTDVNATNNDDTDAAGITVNPITGLETTEIGGTATFSIILNSEPTGSVSIGLRSDNTTEGIITVTGVTFNNTNWNTPQIVTITGVNDDVDDANIIYHIITDAAISGDANYSGLNSDNITLTNRDDDVAGINVSAISGHTTEAGGTATTTIVLTSEPLANVYIGISSDNTGEGTVNTSGFTFNSSNWNTPQTITVTGVNDNIDDGNILYNIITQNAQSTDPRYSGRNVVDVSVYNDDDDAVGVTVSAPTNSGITSETGNSITFTVALESQPISNVIINLTSSATDEGTVSPASLTFTSSNWSSSQIVTVTGVDDYIDDGNINYTISLTPNTTDTKYATYGINNVNLTNTDNDAVGFTVVETSGSTQTNESGTKDNFTVVLNAEPLTPVQIDILNIDATEGSFDKTILTFNNTNWNTPQTITITGVNDDIDDNNITYSIQVAINDINSDNQFDPLVNKTINITNIDDDEVGFTIAETGGTTATSELLTTDEFSIVLNAEPLSPVQIDILNIDATEGSFDKTILTFNSTNWNTPQTITITGVDDAFADGSITYIITAHINDANSDNQFDNLADQTISVTNTDNDIAGITATTISNNVNESGTTATFNIVLNTLPEADVTINLSSSDTGEGTVTPAFVKFSNTNGQTPQTITVKGVNDFLDDGNIPFLIVTAAAISTDVDYSGVNVGDISVINIDNDTSRVNVTAISNATAENGTTATFNVTLNCEPTGNVVIDLLSTNAAEGTLSDNTITFNASNWNIPKTITVTGVNDDIDDGNQNYNIKLSINTTATLDNIYDALTIKDVAVVNNDDDIAGFTISAISNDITELTANATFTVRLTSEPTANVNINLSSSDITEGVINISNLTFTPANWNSIQTITVTGVDDDLPDGDITFDIVLNSATSTDANYNGLNPNDVSVTNLDDGTPVANNDNSVTDEDVTLLINILDNDTGLDDGGLQLTITKKPDHGTYSLNGNTSINYLPNKNYYGTETMSYRICDIDNECSTADITITVNPINDYIPLLTNDRRGASINETITVDVLFNDAGLDDGGITVSKSIDPTNGSIIVNPDNTINYTPNNGYLGIDTFDYRVCDRDGDCASAIVTVTVKLINYNPIANDDYATTEVNKKVTTNVLINDTDLNDTVKSVKVIIPPTKGSTKVNNNNTITYTPATNFVGLDSITYLVTDAEGDYDMAKVYYTITTTSNNVPIAVNDRRATAINTPRTIDVLVNDKGLADGGIIVDTITSPTNGTLVINSNNKITYTPNNNYLGYDSFNYQVCDIDKECSSATVTIEVNLTNAIPVANRDIEQTYTETKVTTNVLANDTGLEDGVDYVSIYKQGANGIAYVNSDNTISYTPVLWYNGIDSIQYMVEDINGDLSIASVVYTITPRPNFIPVAVNDERGATINTKRNIDVLINDTGLEDGGLVLSLPTQPVNGSAIINADTVIYTPNTDWLGTDNFTYQVCDINGDCSTASITVYVKENNDIPIAVNDSATTYMSTAVRTNVLSNDSGLNDGVKQVTIHKNPINGKTIVNTDNTITYTPNNWYLGTDSIQYMVEDTDGDPSIATVIYTITPKPNFIPVAVDDERGATINITRKVDVLINDTGLEDGGLVITLPTQPSNGNAIVSADTVIYTPDTGWLGVDAFTYQVCDTNGDCSTANISINVKEFNALPIAVNDIAQTYMATLVTTNVLNNDLGLEDGIKSVSIDKLPINGKATVNNDNTINYTPAPWYIGTDSLKYKVTDNDGDNSIATVIYTITTVPNFIPVANNDNRGTSLNTTVNVDVLFNDSGLEDGGIIVTAIAQPQHGTATVTTSNTINYSPEDGYLGTDNFDYQVCDADNDCSIATVTITVKDPNYNPAAANDARQTYKNTPVTINVLNNDSGLEDGLKGIDIYANPSNGKIVINSDNTITYTPANWYLGTDVFTYIITDTEGDYSTAQVTITIIEKPDFMPIANDDRRGAQINTPRNVNVLINDKGIDDVPLIVTTTKLPANGTVSINADNSILYTPNNDYLGLDSLEYRVCDADGDCDTATLVINVKLTNDNPVAVDDIAFTNINTSVDINVLNNDLQLSDGIDKVTIYLETINGTAKVNSDNTITYTPANWYEGTDKFEYMVEDNDGDLSIARVTVTISGKANNIPVAVDDRRATTINTDRIINVLINDKGLGDGGLIVSTISLPINGGILVNSNNTITYTPNNEYLGIDSLEYQVCDIDGECDTAKVVINTKLTNAIPIAVADVKSTYLNTKVNINVIKNDTGLEDGGIKVTIYSKPSNGTLNVLTDNTINYTPANWYIGTDKFQYTVEDADGDLSMAEVTITITNIPNFIPVANNDGRGTIINTPVIIDVLINDTGLEDGIMSLITLTNPSNGTASVNQNNTITYIPDNGYLGVNTFEYKVCDNDGDCDSATVTVNVKLTNALPLAIADTFNTTLNTAIDVNVLKNDTGLEDGLGAISIYSYPTNGSFVIHSNRTITYTPDNWYLGTDKFEYMIKDADGDYSIAEVVIKITEMGNHKPLAVNDRRGAVINTQTSIDVLFNDTGLEDGGIIISQTSNPTNGISIANSNNEITYTPNNNYLGIETLEYRVCDVDGECDTATVTINVKLTNAVPKAVKDVATTELNTPVNINVIKNDAGLEDGVGKVTIYSQPANGTVTVNADNTITYTPANWYIGTDMFEYYVEDTDGDYSLAEVNITITEKVNHIPVAINDSRGTMVNISVNVNVLVNDTNLDDGGIIVTTTSNPSNGSIYVNSNNTITYSPTANFNGTDRFSYSVADIDGESSTAEVTITVKDTNNLPVAIDDIAKTTMNVPVTANILNNDKGLEDGGFGVTIYQQPSNGSIVVNSDNTVTYTPAKWYTGTDQFEYMVSDIDGDNDIATVVITIEDWSNHIPDAIDDSRGTIINNMVSIDVLHNDIGIEDGGIVVTVATNPSSGSVEVSNNTINYTPNNDYSGNDGFTYQVCDKDGECDIANVTILVKSENNIPNAVNDTVIALMNNPVVIDVLTNDTGLEDGFREIIIYEQPLNGTVIVNADNTLIFTPANWYHSNVEFYYTVSDIDGDFSEAKVVVKVLNSNNAPIANNDYYECNEGKSISINNPGILANDTDADGHYLTVSLVTKPKYGEFTINTDGSFTYTHNGSTNYTDIFTYKAFDGIYNSTEATVTIQIVGINIKPEAINDTIIVKRTVQSTDYNIIINDFDANNDPIIVKWINNETDSTINITGRYGQLSWNTDGSVTYILNTEMDEVRSSSENEKLSDSFTYSISDGVYSDTAIITIDIQGETTFESIIIPKGFSPNGDGINDVFVIENMEDYPDNVLYIYNRWGTKVYHQSNYDNTWDGRSMSSGKKVTVGTYFYSFFPYDGGKPIKGYVYIRY